MAELGTIENPYVVGIPGWDDIIKIHPRLQWWETPEVAKADWKEFFKRQKAGTLDGMEDQKKRKEIERKWGRIERSSKSPTPIWAQGVAAAMTFIDDVEDMLSTGLLATKYLIKYTPWLAARLGVRMIPVFGFLLTIRDLLEIGNVLWTLLPCGRKGKRQGFDVINPMNIGKQARFKRAAKFWGGKLHIGDIIEAAQSTEMLFGTGLQLGGIVGALSDMVFGSIKGLKGEPVRWQWDKPPRKYGDYVSITNGFDSAARFLMGATTPGQDEHAICLVGIALAIQNLQPILNSEEMIRKSNEIQGWSVYKKIPWEPMTRLLLQEYGIDPDREEPHFLPGSPDQITYEEMAEIYYNQGLPCIQNFANMFPRGEDAAFFASTISEIAWWIWNADLPVEEWERYMPEQALTAMEEALLNAYE